MIDIRPAPRRFLLLTGATGLLGSYLVRDLLLDGQELALVVRAGRKEARRFRLFRL